MNADRVVILGGLVLLHGIALAFLVMQRIRVPPPEVAVFLAPISLETQPAHAPQAGAPGPRRAVARPAAPSSTPARPVPSQEPPEAPVALPPVQGPDWAATAAAVVQDQISAQAGRDRQAQALAPRGKPLPGPEPPAPVFHWDPSATERVVPLAQGGVLIRLNDRCALVLMPLPLGACALGKPPVRGDLFEHMRDPPKLGDKLESGSVP